MAIKDKKKQVLAKVNALEKITEDKKESFLNTKSKLVGKKDAEKEAINNKKNKVFEFLTKLSLIVTSFESIKKVFIDTISSKLPMVEKEIKTELKKELKEILSCNIDPSIPAWLKTEGISIKVKEIDFLDMLKNDPTSIGGGLIYNDEKTGLASTDFNTFLYHVIEKNKSVPNVDGGTYFPWGNATVKGDFLDVRFSPKGTINNKQESNVLNFKPNANAINMTLNQFNDKFIDSINIFGSAGSDKVIGKLMDDIFGSIKSNLKLPEAKLVEEEKFKKSVECIINAENEVDDSFFSFSNEEINQMERDLKKRKKGIVVLDCCKANPLKLDTQVLIDGQNDIKNSHENPPPTFNKETSKLAAVQRTVDSITKNATSLVVDPIDIKNINVNFILDMFKKLPLSLISFVISPKLIAIYAVNHQIIYGKDTSFKDPIDFIKKNKNMFKKICKTIAGMVIKALLALIIQKLVVKLQKKLTDDIIEHNKGYVKQVKSLLGGDLIPKDLLKNLKL